LLHPPLAILEGQIPPGLTPNKCYNIQKTIETFEIIDILMILHTYSNNCKIMKLADMFVIGFRNFCRKGVRNFCQNGARKILILGSLLVYGFWLFSSSNCLSFKHIIKLACQSIFQTGFILLSVLPCKTFFFYETLNKSVCELFNEGQIYK